MKAFQPIETERLIIRSFQADDLRDIYERVSDPEVTHYTGGVLSYEEAERSLQGGLLSEKSHSPLGTRAIVLKTNQRNIGYCGLNELPYVETRPTEISYGLTRFYWGNGFATEAARAMIQYAFEVLGLEDVAAAINPANIRSVNVARKLGLKFRTKIEWPSQGLVNLYSLARSAYFQGLRTPMTPRTEFKALAVSAAPRPFSAGFSSSLRSF